MPTDMIFLRLYTLKFWYNLQSFQFDFWWLGIAFDICLKNTGILFTMWGMHRQGKRLITFFNLWHNVHRSFLQTFTVKIYTDLILGPLWNGVAPPASPSREIFWLPYCFTASPLLTSNALWPLAIKTEKTSMHSKREHPHVKNENHTCLAFWDIWDIMCNRSFHFWQMVTPNTFDRHQKL